MWTQLLKKMYFLIFLKVLHQCIVWSVFNCQILGNFSLYLYYWFLVQLHCSPRTFIISVQLNVETLLLAQNVSREVCSCTWELRVLFVLWENLCLWAGGMAQGWLTALCGFSPRWSDAPSQALRSPFCGDVVILNCTFSGGSVFSCFLWGVWGVRFISSNIQCSYL